MVVSLFDSGVMFARAWEASYGLVLHFVLVKGSEQEDFSDVCSFIGILCFGLRRQRREPVWGRVLLI